MTTQPVSVHVAKTGCKGARAKLIRNFITHGKLKTTLKKAKVLKSEIEKFVEKTKIKTEANKNFLLWTLNDKKLVKSAFEQIGATLKDKVGGYVRVVKLGFRLSDGSEIAQLEWVYPVLISEKSDKTEKVNKKLTPKKALSKNIEPEKLKIKSE